MILGAPLGSLLGSEAVRYWFSCHCLAEFRKNTCARGDGGGGGGISYVPPSGALIKSTMNSVKY